MSGTTPYSNKGTYLIKFAHQLRQRMLTNMFESKKSDECYKNEQAFTCSYIKSVKKFICIKPQVQDHKAELC